jgi:hypothetical protein
MADMLTKAEISEKFEEITVQDEFLMKLVTQFIENSRKQEIDYLTQYYISLYLQLKPQEQEPQESGKEE